MDSENGPRFKSLTLSNAAEGVAERQFQEILDLAEDVWAHPGRYEETGKRIVFEVKAEVKLELDLETGSTFVGARCVPKPPKLKVEKRPAYLRGEGFVVEDTEQLDLPTGGDDSGKVRPIRGGEE